MNDSTSLETTSPCDLAAASATEEAGLLARCLRGDLDAFDELVRAQQSRVYNIALRLLGDPEAAQDCAQDTFVRAFNSIKSFRGESALSTWLYRIVTNICLDELRRRKPAESLSPDDDDELDPMERLADTRPNPEQSLLRAERRRAVRRAIRGLPEHHRVVLVLYDLQGCSYEEIAETLRLSLGTVKSRLNRARLALKEKLEPVRELFTE